MKKQKELTEEQKEELAVKDFFDMILPATIKFYDDHYICGDSYRCAWAVREYPPSTDAQATLSQLADRTNVTLRIYNRLVDSLEQRKIIQNATRKNKLMSGGTDVQETIDAESNLKDVVQLLADLRKNREPLLHTAVYMELKAHDMDKLRELAACGNSTETPKSEQSGTAGSNLPLKDNAEEAEYQIKVAMQNLLEETYGDKYSSSFHGA